MQLGWLHYGGTATAGCWAGSWWPAAGGPQPPATQAATQAGRQWQAAIGPNAANIGGIQLLALLGCCHHHQLNQLMVATCYFSAA